MVKCESSMTPVSEMIPIITLLSLQLTQHLQNYVDYFVDKLSYFHSGLKKNARLLYEFVEIVMSILYTSDHC